MERSPNGAALHEEGGPQEARRARDGQVDSPFIRGRSGRLRNGIFATGKRTRLITQNAPRTSWSPPGGQVGTASQDSQPSLARTVHVVGTAGLVPATRPLLAQRASGKSELTFNAP